MSDTGDSTCAPRRRGAVARRIAAALAVASLIGAFAADAAALARRPSAPPTWRMFGPVGLGPGPLFYKPYPGATEWSSSGSAPVVSIASRAGLAAWAGPHGEVLAAIANHGDEWQPPAQTAPAISPKGRAPEVVPALDPQGDALLGWASDNIGEGNMLKAQIGSSYRAQGSGAWNAPSVLGAVANCCGTGSAPSVGFDPRGDGTAIWTQPNGVVMASYMPAGTGSWETPVMVAASAVGSRPSLAVDAAGDATAVWEFPGGRGTLLAAAIRTSGAGWSVPVTLGPAGKASVVALRGRAAMVVWRVEGEREEAPAPLVYATADLASGRWSGVHRLAADVPQLQQRGLGVAVGGKGQALVWWTTSSRVDAQVSLRARVRGPRGHWGPSATVASWRPAAESTASANPTCRGGSEPSVAFDAREDAIATWEEGCGGTFDSLLRSRSNRWSAAGSLGRVIGRHVAPVFALTPRGELTAVWLERGAAEGPSGERLPTTVAAAVLQARRSR